MFICTDRLSGCIFSALMVIREGHLRLLQIAVAGRNAPDGPEVVGGDNLGLEEGLERLGIVALLLVAEPNLLVHLGVGVIGSREPFEEFERLVVISRDGNSIRR